MKLKSTQKPILEQVSQEAKGPESEGKKMTLKCKALKDPD